MKKKRVERPQGRARPVADRARDAAEELDRGGPTVTRLGELDGDDPFGQSIVAGVTAAGQSDKPAGTHVAPEYPVGDVAPEIDVDSVFSVSSMSDGTEPAPGEHLDDYDVRPEDPVPFDELDEDDEALDEVDRPATALPHATEPRR